ncbi:MAG TPA: M28 family peptidase [Solirubrobacterales bacterium]
MSSATAGRDLSIATPPSAGRMRALLDDLCSFERETATEGERRAADWVAERLREHGLEPRLETERIHSTYWWPLGIASAAGVAAGIAARRGRRGLGAALGLLGAAAAADDMPGDGRRRLRSLLPARTATQLVAEAGPADAERTVVVSAHHDAAHTGVIFHPAIPELADRAGLIERSDTSPPLIAIGVGAPLAAGLGALAGSRALAGAGAFLSAGFGAAMANLGMSSVVPGANDNGTGVLALIALAEALARRPTESVRVILLSTSEEATCEGMEAFARRHFGELSPESTFFLSVDTVGSPHLCVLRGEGMLRMKEYPAESLALVDGLAEDLGIHLFPNLRLRNATDGVIPLFAGYQCASLASCTDLKQPSNYHWRTDVPENVDFGSVADAIRLSEAVVRRLDEEWL